MNLGIDFFYLFVVDRDRQQFNCLGPMHDDDPWNASVASAMDEQLRDVGSFVVSVNDTEDMIKRYKDKGWTVTYEPLVPYPTTN